MKLLWKKGVPEKAGWYWVRKVSWEDGPVIGRYWYTPDQIDAVFHFMDDYMMYIEKELTEVEWAGPISEPEEA